MRHLSPEEFQAEVDGLDVALALRLTKKPEEWNFDDLHQRAQTLLAQAQTALERGRARLVLEKIAQSAEIKRRYDTVNQLWGDVQRQDRPADELLGAAGSGAADPSSAGRFDAVGRLARVVSSKLGAPRYALLDENAKPRCYVTPAPGVNMRYYEGRQVGINGIRGFTVEPRAPHLTAKYVTALEDQTLR